LIVACLAGGLVMESISPFYSHTPEVRYCPPWQDLSIIGIAGSSGSGKTSVAMEIVRSLNLPWVVILVMVHLLSSRVSRFGLTPGPGLILQDVISRRALLGAC